MKRWRIGISRIALGLPMAAVLCLAGAASAVYGPPVVLEPGTFNIQADIGTGSRDITLGGRVGASAQIVPADFSMEQNELSLKARYAFRGGLSPYLVLGMGSMNLGKLSFGSGFGQLDLEGDAGLLWGLGVDYHFPIFHSAPDLITGAMFEYRNRGTEFTSGSLEADEFILALKAAKKYDVVTVYGGPMFNVFDGVYSGTTSTGAPVSGDVTGQKSFGIFLGGDYEFSERLTGRVEGRLLSEQVVNLGLVYNFHPGAPTAPRAPRAEPPAPTRRAPQAPATAEASAPPKTVVAPAPEVLRRDVRAAQEQLQLGNDLFKLGKTAEAISYYRRAIEFDPGNFRAHYNLATARYYMKDYGGARDAYRSAISLSPDDIESHLYLGYSLYRLGDARGAARAWQRVLELDPRNSVALNNLQALGR